ncbi:MAG: ribonuclease E/G [Paracoccus sp. (in: a-proteobacteria)]|uniref:Rne/Rng family ribonuclease n=1 Tax=Paracoccus sp. TaxID=267 RepID=UPI0026DFF460|nr:ribonuclease E/G [Paracoccus sp. (in: a-proteobacteria)]MDO5622446.1 ribonuclease E/G [Paracoccus sp. (in: a-proteobacteria)]
MAKKMLIDATHAEETRVVVVDGTKVEEFDFETVNKRQLAGNIYLAKVTRVEPSLQAAFVDYGGNRHGFLAFAEIHPDYYQIPAADRQALIEEERAHAEAAAAEESARADKKSRSRRPAKAEAVVADAEAVASDEVAAADAAEAGADAPVSEQIAGMEIAPEAEDEAAEQGADEAIESLTDEDVTEEARAPRKPRARRYKIQEVIKVRQIMLVQVVKEERGNKGAALTTYLSLAGRYCVLMPNTARGGGISRKITNAADRKKLKDIAGELAVPEGAGLIIRTAGSQRTRTEIKRDYEYLMRLWEQIRELTFKSIAPAPIYEEGDLIKRTIRDLYSKEIDEVLVEGERGYRVAKDFMKMIMPSHAKNVKHYADPMPLYARYQVESYLGGMFNPVVQLKSGGYIVIGITEALVAIDVNSGRATKEGSIEDTAYKTNCEAADEIARQLRLRDLAGLIVVDFIDMDERKNNAAVEKRFKDKLKSDRARIQVGKISGFGLLEMSRQRLRPGMLESTTQPCAHCHGTGLIRSDDSMALTILRAIEEEGTRRRSREVLVKAPVAVANFLMNGKREHIGMIEARYGMSVRVEADPSLISPDYSIEKFKTAIRSVPEVTAPVVSVSASLMAQIDEAAEDEDDDIIEAADEGETAVTRAETDSEDGEGGGRSKRRRRRRRKKNGDGAENGADTADSDSADSDDEAGVEAVATEVKSGAGADAEPKSKSRSRSRSRSRKKADAVEDMPVEGVADEVAQPAPLTETQAADGAATEESADMAAVSAAEVEAPQAAPVAELAETAPAADPVAASDEAPAVEQIAAPDEAEPAPAPEAVVEPVPAEPAKPKRRGWWSA